MPKDVYSLDAYRWYQNASESYTKYNLSDNKLVLDPEDDAATVALGEHWALPSSEQSLELLDTTNCSWTYTERNGIIGYEVKSKMNDNSIFLPAGGCKENKNSSDIGKNGYYWTVESANFANGKYGNMFYFYPTYTQYNALPKYRGYSLRPIYRE